jgi:hypothetical protein
MELNICFWDALTQHPDAKERRAFHAHPETPRSAKRQHILDVAHPSQGILPSHLIACEVLTDVVPMPLAVVDIEVIAPTLDKPCTPASLKRMIDAVLSNEGPEPAKAT